MPSIKLSSQQQHHTAVMQPQPLMKEERERRLTKLLQLQNGSSSSACNTPTTMKKTGAFYRRLDCFRESRDYSFLKLDAERDSSCAPKTSATTDHDKLPPPHANALLSNPKPPTARCTSSNFSEHFMEALKAERERRRLIKLMECSSSCTIKKKNAATTTKRMKKSDAFYRRLELFRKSRDYSFLMQQVDDDDGRHHEEACNNSGLQAAAKTTNAPSKRPTHHKRPPALVNPQPPVQCSSSSSSTSSRSANYAPSNLPAMVASCNNKTLKSSARPSNYSTPACSSHGKGTPACSSHGGKASGTKPPPRRAEAEEAGKGKLLGRSKGLEPIDEEEEGGDAASIRSTIWKMFNYNPAKRAAQEEDGRTDDRAMVSNFRDIQREEKRSAKIAHEEDRHEEELLKMEERQDKAARLAAKRRRLG